MAAGFAVLDSPLPDTLTWLPALQLQLLVLGDWSGDCRVKCHKPILCISLGHVREQHCQLRLLPMQQGLVMHGTFP